VESNIDWRNLMVRSLFGLGRALALVAVGGLCLEAEGTQTARVTGVVVDGEGGPVADATVRLASPALPRVRMLATDAQGRFSAHFLPPGPYEIEITHPAYPPMRIRELLGIDQHFQPRFRMVRQPDLVVEVTAQPPAVDKTDPKSATNYRLDRMDRLPVDRTPEGLALLTPGVTLGVGGGVQIRGAMTSGNLVLVDGQNVEDGAYGERGVSLIEDGLEEVQVLTGALPAEYGYVDGGVINAITRSGSNTFTGQVRWDVRNPAWNAVAPKVDRGAIDDRTTADATFSLAGYLIKDRLWFHAAHFLEDFREVRTISSEAFRDPSWSQGADAAYTYGRDERRRQLKLTWQPHADHTLVASYLGSQATHTKRDYLSGSLDTLVPQRNDDELLSLAWRALWSPRLITDVRLGTKRQGFQTGMTHTSKDLSTSPLYESESGLFYNRGVFNGDDGGDHRDNRTFSAKASWFLEGHGSHTLDVGISGYDASRRARNEKSPTGYVFQVSEIDPVAGTAIPQSVWVYDSRGGAATVENRGAFVNDTWLLGDRLALQLGLRWDHYRGRDENGHTLASSGAWSPRLGAKYDLKGDARWILGASYARYNGKLLDQVLTSATRQGNIAEVDFLALDDTTRVPFSAIFDLSNYDFSAAGLSYANLPGVNLRISPRMKSPSIHEAQLSLAHAFKDSTAGTGYVRATAVYKKWTDLVDYRIGNDGQASYVFPETGEVIHPYVQHWDNNPDATRDYRGLELDFSSSKGRWQFQGNLTWSRLWGNYEGQDAFTPGRGEGIHAWDVTDGTVMFDRHITAPSGYLKGHVPFRARLMGTFTTSSRLGKTTWGLMYRYDAGSRESETRLISGEALNPALPEEARNSWFTQYRDRRRGGLKGNPAWYLDLSVNHEWKVGTVRKVPVTGFLKVVVKNVLNHKQLLRTPRSYEAAAVSPDEPWVPDASDRKAGADCYGEPRTYAFAAGLRF